MFKNYMHVISEIISKLYEISTVTWHASFNTYVHVAWPKMAVLNSGQK